MAIELVAELVPELLSETEVCRIERDDRVTPETPGLTLDEGKRLVAAVQVEIVRAQVTVTGERFRWCEHCRTKLISKGYYPATVRSLFGNVPVRVRRLCVCRCEADAQDNETFSALAVTRGIAPELAYVTARFAALVPFAKMADLLVRTAPDRGRHKRRDSSKPHHAGRTRGGQSRIDREADFWNRGTEII